MSLTRTPSDTQRAEATRIAIVAVAERLFRAMGYQKTAVADIARDLGMSPADISQTLATLRSGTAATQLRAGTKLIDVTLRATESERANLASLPDLSIPTDANSANSAASKPSPRTPSSGAVTAILLPDRPGRHPGRPASPDVTALALPRLKALTLPHGVRIETGGAAEESAKANGALAAVFPVMAATMVVLLMIQLQNLPRALMALATAPRPRPNP